jgi:hypothetical protein
MGKHSSENQKCFIEFDKTDTNKDEIQFQINASSFGFSVHGYKFWFYQSDIDSFANKASAVLSGVEESATLSAMSEFKLTLVPKDKHGHFKVKLNIEHRFDENMAEIYVELETQSVVNLISDLTHSLT